MTPEEVVSDIWRSFFKNESVNFREVIYTGRVEAPSSKSFTLRALNVCLRLAKGKCYKSLKRDDTVADR